MPEQTNCDDINPECFFFDANHIEIVIGWLQSEL